MISGGPEHGGAVDAVGAEVGQGAVGGVQRVWGGGDPQWVFGGEAEELPRVGAGVGGDAAQLAFLEEVVLVHQRREVGQVDAGDGQCAAPVQGGQGGRHEVAD